jgi:flagellar assembly factor FliW
VVTFEVVQEGVYEVYITLTQGIDTFEHVYKFTISDAKRLQAEYEGRVVEPVAAAPGTVQ